MRVNPYSTSGMPVYDAGRNNRKADVPNEKSAGQGQTDVLAVKVDISDNAQAISKGFETYDENSRLKRDEAFFSQDAIAQRKLNFAKTAMEPVTIDPFDNAFQIAAVTGVFNDGTLEKFIADSLEGKAKNASLVANELGQMIRGTIHNPNATVEERATSRETALRLAEHIARDYFDNPDEARAFLDGINRFAENDVLREKGYIVFDNAKPDVVPFRSYTLATDGSVNWSEYAKKYGKSDVREIFSNPKELQSFVNALSSNSQKWDAEIVAAFEDNEKRVADMISYIKGTLNEDHVAGSLQRILKAFDAVPPTAASKSISPFPNGIT